MIIYFVHGIIYEEYDKHFLTQRIHHMKTNILEVFLLSRQIFKPPATEDARLPTANTSKLYPCLYQ